MVQQPPKKGKDIERLI